jgi:hypothetical protein
MFFRLCIINNYKQMKKFAIEIKWAIIFIIMMLLWMLMEKLTGLHDVNIDKHPIVTNFVAIPAILIYVLAFLEKRKKSFGGHMTYLQGFVTGIIITVIVTIFTPLTQWITTEFITPHYFENAINYSVESGYMTREAAQEYFNLSNYMVMSTFGAFVMGVVTSAIIAIFTIKKDKS